MKRFFSFFLIIIFSFSLFSCNLKDEKNFPDGEKLNIVATSFAQYSLAKEIVGNLADVELLIPAGLDTHSYDLTFSDIKRLSNADFVISAGEAWMSSVLPVILEKHVTLIDISDNLELISGPHDHEHDYPHIFDMHVLSSPKNAICAAERIYDALCVIDSDNSFEFNRNYSALNVKLKAIDDELNKISQEKNSKKLYFGGKFSNLYLCENYGFDYLTAYEGCSEYSEPSPKTLKNIIDMMIQEDADVIFVSELSEIQTAQKICASVGCEILVMHSCHEISKEDFENGETYLSLMKRNIENIREALS